MTRKKSPNRTPNNGHKIECVRKHRDGTTVSMKVYVHIDRVPLDEDGLHLGHVCRVRITPDNSIAGSLFEEVMHQASDLITREVQTVEKVLAE